MNIDRRHLLASSGAALALAAFVPARAQPGRALTPEMFGAKGDGKTNDTAAFAALSDAVEQRGGGMIMLRKTTYIVGAQRPRPAGAKTGYAYEPAPLIELRDLRGSLVIRGNGAKLQCAPGLRYGTFDRASGRKTSHTMPFLDGTELSSPYRAMIHIEGCLGDITISDIELDGNLRAHALGGPWGDTGYQIPATGIILKNNRGWERLSNIYAHHHAQDGLMIDGVDAVRSNGARTTLDNVRSEYNGRQGLSIVGGRGFTIRSSQFNHTGKGGIASAPGSGIDIEAEGGKRVRDLVFDKCEVANNTGAGLVADSGDSEDARFTRCSFIGTTNWSAWPNKPRFRFAQCIFVGAFVHAIGDRDPARATQFTQCRFLDDPALSPTGKVYGGENPDRPIGDLPDNINVRFDRCDFHLTHQAVLPWTTNVIYADCTLSQVSTTMSFPRGTYIGRNVLTGNSNISGSNIIGTLIGNGRTFSGRV
ncbi:hypothetical protein FSZ31_06015 [Sphingorhabdus soli]|uniref:Right-handed parallel beta-helix repeat-containing protein n=1 Tax=Flavisphingopyxis soli TaxID=2601267 RepID=A0A5C6UMJ8_9SPHN|nr:right-handed parallel beta-helix repeat-containing protein [Sphingorhabdus soli]TXC74257.1 hypothetical protein FSZ31_06015 [Sphingorhabdus soli]